MALFERVACVESGHYERDYCVVPLLSVSKVNCDVNGKGKRDERDHIE